MIIQSFKYTIVLVFCLSASNSSSVLIAQCDTIESDSVLLDTIPPGKILDLAVDSTGDGIVYLSWSAPGDDGIPGYRGKDWKPPPVGMFDNVVAYDVRYSTDYKTLLDWTEADSAPNIPKPLPIASKQTMVIHGLDVYTGYVFAVKSVDKAGNYSEISFTAHCFPIVDTIIHFPDSTLEKAIRIALTGTGLRNSQIVVRTPPGYPKPPRRGPIRREDVLRITSLECGGDSLRVKSLDGIQLLNHLQFLSLLNPHSLCDLNPLVELGELETLKLICDSPQDLSTLSELRNIKQLYLSGNGIVDLQPLSELRYLKHLYLSGKSIVDLKPLANLTKLEEVSILRTGVIEITPLTSMNNLTSLKIEQNKISDITPIENLTNLTELNITSNDIIDISPLANLTRLKILNLSLNPISNINALRNLVELEELYFSGIDPIDIYPMVENMMDIRRITQLRILFINLRRLSESALKEYLPLFRQYGVDIR